MKILKVKSRTYKGKAYYKYRINVPEDLLRKAGFKEGDELKAWVGEGEMRLRRRNLDEKTNKR